MEKVANNRDDPPQTRYIIIITSFMNQARSL